jgi:predicted acetyltransferase
MRAGGFPISVLYASTFPLYRRAGWEHAGSLFEARLPLRLLPRPSRPPRARLETADDRDAIEAIYRARACRHHGWTDRGHYVWERIRSPLATQCEVLVVTDDQGTPSGYVMFMRDRSEDWLDVQVMDWCATSPGAVRDVVSVLANEASMGANLRIPCLPGDPLLAHLPERGAAVQLRECWMLRLNDVPAALNARGWPPGVRAEVNLDVEDPVVVENAGRWCITVEDGNVEVTAGGSGAIRIGVRALAPLYSGHATAETLALAGQLQGPAEDLADATRAFAAPSPTMVDFF